MIRYVCTHVFHKCLVDKRSHFGYVTALQYTGLIKKGQWQAATIILPGVVFEYATDHSQQPIAIGTSKDEERIG